MTELLMHRCFRITEPDLIAFYGNSKDIDTLILKRYRGYKPEPESLDREDESVDFMLESQQTVSLLNIKENEDHPFRSILLKSGMRAGFALPAGGKGILFLNFLHPYRFSFDQIKETEELINRWRAS